jgi:hypothetical protein
VLPLVDLIRPGGLGDTQRSNDESFALPASCQKIDDQGETDNALAHAHVKEERGHWVVEKEPLSLPLEDVHIFASADHPLDFDPLIVVERQAQNGHPVVALSGLPNINVRTLYHSGGS